MEETVTQGKINVGPQHIDKRYAHVEINISNLSWKSPAFDRVTPFKCRIITCLPRYKGEILTIYATEIQGRFTQMTFYCQKESKHLF